MSTAPVPSDRPRATPAPKLPMGFRGWLRRWLGIDEMMGTYGRAIINHQQLVEGQRRDFDHLGEVLGLRDQLDDDRNLTHTKTGARVEKLERELQGALGALYSALDRLAWHETRIPVLHKSKKAYEAAVAKEKKRREELVAAHPELSEEGKSIVMRTGKLPEPRAETPSPAEAPPTTESVLELVRSSDTEGLAPDVVRRLELGRAQAITGGRTPSPSEREEAAEAAAREVAAAQERMTEAPPGG